MARNARPPQAIDIAPDSGRYPTNFTVKRVATAKRSADALAWGARRPERRLAARAALVMLKPEAAPDPLTSMKATD
jgi:hypothetical protein